MLSAGAIYSMTLSTLFYIGTATPTQKRSQAIKKLQVFSLSFLILLHFKYYFRLFELSSKQKAHIVMEKWLISCSGGGNKSLRLSNFYFSRESWLKRQNVSD